MHHVFIGRVARRRHLECRKEPREHVVALAKESQLREPVPRRRLQVDDDEALRARLGRRLPDVRVVGEHLQARAEADREVARLRVLARTLEVGVVHLFAKVNNGVTQLCAGARRPLAAALGAVAVVGRLAGDVEAAQRLLAARGAALAEDVAVQLT